MALGGVSLRVKRLRYPPLILTPDVLSGERVLRASLDSPELLARDGYISGGYLKLLAKRSRRGWEMPGRLTTVQTDYGGYWRSSDAFSPRHSETAEAFTAFLEESTSLSCPLPTSYASIFSANYQSAMLPATINIGFRPQFRGAWQSALRTGIQRGPHFLYDLRSAYLWASTLGLPKLESLRYSDHIGRKPGLYVVELSEARSGAPYPFNAGGIVNATTDEIDGYGLPLRRILFGATWSETEPPDLITSIVNRASFWKEMGRSYWGQWASRLGPIAWTQRTRYQMRNPWENLIWASVILARVKLRLYEAIGNDGVHVYVDSVMVPRKLPEGPNIGDWRLAESYPDGVRIAGPGRYGPPIGPLDKHAGTAYNSIIPGAA